MRPLPPKGLIVSCYLASMVGCEKQFIKSVIDLPGVVALRVEGIENVRYARHLSPDKYIIGLVKIPVADNGSRYGITPSIKWAMVLHQAGADMIATGCLPHWYNTVPSAIATAPFYIMYDMTADMDAYIPDKHRAAFEDAVNSRRIVLATTYVQKAFRMRTDLRIKYPQAIINLEGGIETGIEVQEGLEDADWVTIGAAINDPPAIIDKLLGDMEEERSRF